MKRQKIEIFLGALAEEDVHTRSFKDRRSFEIEATRGEAATLLDNLHDVIERDFKSLKI